MKRKDVFASLVLGEIIGLFLTLILKRSDFPFSPWIFPFIMPIIVLFGVFAAGLIGKKIPLVFQFVKFIVTGLANTLVDAGILIILADYAKIYSGKNIIFLNSISFVIAVIHSYFWNKLWTFGVKKTDASKEFLQFLVVSLFGLLINGGIVYMITTWLKPMFGLAEDSWVLVAKLCAAAISLFWNFVGYRFIVFKKRQDQITSNQNINKNI